MTDRIKTALVTGGAKRIGGAIVEDLAAHGFAVAIHCNRSVDEAAALAEEIAAAGGRAMRGRRRPHRHGRGRRPGRSRRGRARAARPAGQQRLDLRGRLAPSISTWRCWDRHFAIHVKAPVLLAGKLAGGTAGRRRRAGRQHHRPARLEADAALFLLHAVEVGAVDGDADAGAGAGAQGAGQRHRPGPDAAEHAPGRGRFRTRRSTGCS